MARIRTVKPEIWTDPDFVECSQSARLLLIASLNFASDFGVLADKPVQLKMQCFPGDSIDVAPLVDELVAAEFYVRRVAPDGAKVLVIRSFTKHQRIDKPTKGRWGDPEDWPETHPEIPEPSSSAPRVLDEPSPLEGKGMEGNGKGMEEITPLSSSQANPTSGAAEIRAVFEHWQHRLDHPQAKLDDKRRRAIKARLADGYTVDQLRTAIDGILLDPHKMGHNDRGRKFDDIELACRTAANVDALIDLATKGPTARTPRGPETTAQKHARISAMFGDTQHPDGRPLVDADTAGYPELSA